MLCPADVNTRSSRKVPRRWRSGRGPGFLDNPVFSEGSFRAGARAAHTPKTPRPCSPLCWGGTWGGPGRVDAVSQPALPAGQWDASPGLRRLGRLGQGCGGSGSSPEARREQGSFRSRPLRTAASTRKVGTRTQLPPACGATKLFCKCQSPQVRPLPRGGSPGGPQTRRRTLQATRASAPGRDGWWPTSLAGSATVAAEGGHGLSVSWTTRAFIQNT